MVMPSLREVLHDAQHLAGQLGIERRGHLVEQHHLRLHRQRAGDGDALLLAAGKLLGIGVELVGQADRASTSAARSLRLVLGLLLHQRRRQRDVPLDGQMREEVVALEHDADVAPQLSAASSCPARRPRGRTLRSGRLSTVSSRSMQRSAVLLPEPLRPMMATTWPASRRSRRRRARAAAPNSFDARPRRRRRFAVLIGRHAAFLSSVRAATDSG